VVKEASGPSIAPPSSPPVPAVYFGDPTEEEVIENVRNLPDRRPGGKVRMLDSFEQEKKTDQGTKSQNDFLREWLPQRAMYLKTMLAGEAPRDPMSICATCGKREAKWRCKNCFGGRMLCSVCCRNEHLARPFHRIEAWNGRHFAVGALWQVGLKLYLGHQGMPCPEAAYVPREAGETIGKWVLTPSARNNHEYV